VWTDTRGGTRANGKQDLARGLAAFRAPEDLSTTLKTLLRIVGIALALTGFGLIGYAASRRGRGDDDTRPRQTRPRAPRARQRV
jgi:hypothetical protein